MLEHSMILADCREDNSCENNFTALIDVLRKELELYSELKELILKEKQVIIRPSLDELYENNARKENIILKARMLEDARAKILKKISLGLDIKIETVTLAQIAKHASYEQKKEINEIKGELASISQHIKMLNEINKDLISTSITNVRGTIEFVDSIISRGTVYMETGEVKSAPNNGKYLHTEG